MGEHAVSCHGQVDMIYRRERIGDEIISACSEAYLFTVCEQKRVLPDKNYRLGDILLPV